MVRVASVLVCVSVWWSLQCSAVDYAPVVRLWSGRVRGIVQSVENGQKVLLYQGIPYGQTNGRFCKAQPMGQWAGVYNGTYFREACPQMGLQSLSTSTTTTTMSEECLYVNVWRPRRNRMMNLPTRSVMVFMHGNFYERGTIFSDHLDARYVASRGDVVVVSVQYRLGPLGFLYGGTDNAPGNLGLHDQILALRWVRHNIARFGGDHNQVTVVGQSAGAMSVGALILSPLTHRLFRRAILQSGAPNSFYGGINKTEALRRTTELADSLACPTTPVADAVNCLRYNRTADQIVHATKDAFAKNQLFLPIYGDEVLPQKPTEALKSGKFNHIDLMFGVNQNEGAIYASMFLPDPQMLDGRSAREALKWMMEFYGKTFGDEVVEHYTANLTEEATREQLISSLEQTWGDFNVVCPLVHFGEQLARQAPGKSYFSYRMTTPKWNATRCAEWNGLCFQPDVRYLFAELNDKSTTSSTTKLSAEELQLSKDMIGAWTWFAKRGHVRNRINTNQTWSRAFESGSSATRVFVLQEANSTMLTDAPYNRTCNDFWKDKLFDDETKQLFAFSKMQHILYSLKPTQ